MERISNRIGIPGAVESLIGGRNENQDDFGFSETQLGLLVVVCDGMGGGPAGRTASGLARDTIIRQLSEAKITDKPEEVLYNAVIAANNALLGAIAAKPELQGMGTTCVCLLVNRKFAYIAHVGDSRCYQLRRGQTVFRTADHSYVGELVRRNTISEEEARQSKYSNVITRAIGVGQTVEPEIDKVTVKPGDRFALMSDGIWGSMPENQLVENLSNPAGLDTLVPAIAQKVDQIGINEGGGHDNLTLAMVQLPGATQPQPVKPTQPVKPIQQPAQQKTAKQPAMPKPVPVKDKETPQAPTDSDLHITITELADEGASRRKNIWIWVLSLLLIAVIGVLAWLLLFNHDKENDTANDKSKYANIDNRSKNAEDDYEEHYGLNDSDGQGHSTLNITSTQHQDRTDLSQIIGKNKDEQDDAEVKRNANMSPRQQILSNSAKNLRDLIAKYRKADEIKKDDNNDGWDARTESIQNDLTKISKTIKGTLGPDNPNNTALMDIIRDIEALAKSSALIDSNRGRPTHDTEKKLNEVVAKLENLSGTK